MSAKICVSGKIATGKTTVSRELSRHFGYQIVSFGDIMRAYLNGLGVEPTREAMHAQSHRIVTEIGNFRAMDWFIDNSSDIDWQGNLIVDGCRHPETYKRLQELFDSCFLIHCSCCAPTQIKRIQERDKLSITQINKIVAHPVEEDLDRHFIVIADIVKREDDQPEIVVKQLISLLEEHDRNLAVFQNRGGLS